MSAAGTQICFYTYIFRDTNDYKLCSGLPDFLFPLLRIGNRLYLLPGFGFTIPYFGVCQMIFFPVKDKMLHLSKIGNTAIK